MTRYSAVDVAALPPVQVVRVWAIIDQLTPLQRAVLGSAGTPRWLDGSQPWQPGTTQEVQAAHGLFVLGVVERVGLAAYRLTHLGEVVAGVLLHQVMVGKGGKV